MLDIIAMLDAINAKANLEKKKSKKISKKEDNKKNLEKLNRGQITIGTIFKSKDGKVNKITNLTQQITNVINFKIVHLSIG